MGPMILNLSKDPVMYAIIDDKGKQYKVSVGEEVVVDLMKAQVGEYVEFDRVLMVGGEGDETPRMGRPQVEGARVLAEVLRHEKGPKVTMLRYNPTSKPSRVKKGHRQKHTRVLIREVLPE